MPTTAWRDELMPVPVVGIDEQDIANNCGCREGQYRKGGDHRQSSMTMRWMVSLKMPQ